MSTKTKHSLDAGKVLEVFVSIVWFISLITALSAIGRSELGILIGDPKAAGWLALLAILAFMFGLSTLLAARRRNFSEMIAIIAVCTIASYLVMKAYEQATIFPVLPEPARALTIPAAVISLFIAIGFRAQIFDLKKL